MERGPYTRINAYLAGLDTAPGDDMPPGKRQALTEFAGVLEYNHRVRGNRERDAGGWRRRG